MRNVVNNRIYLALLINRLAPRVAVENLVMLKW